MSFSRKAQKTRTPLHTALHTIQPRIPRRFDKKNRQRKNRAERKPRPQSVEFLELRRFFSHFYPLNLFKNQLRTHDQCAVRMKSAYERRIFVHIQAFKNELFPFLALLYVGNSKALERFLEKFGHVKTIQAIIRISRIVDVHIVVVFGIGYRNRIPLFAFA
jgi:hypothetical protein